MADIDKSLSFESYKEVKDYYSSREECILLGKYMHVFRVNAVKNIRPELDSHIFMAVDMVRGIELDIPRASLPKNKCSDSDNDEIHAIEFFQFKDGDPEDEEDFIGPERARFENRVIN